jgi:hypothetical protein
MGQESFLLLFLCLTSAAISAVDAQAFDACSTELPAVLAGNYSGLNCRIVWNNFVLRVI